MPYIYTLEADVTDASSRQVSASGSVTVVPSLVSLNVKTGQLPGQAGRTAGDHPAGRQLGGTPRALPVRLSFGRQVYDKKTRSYQLARERAPAS